MPISCVYLRQFSVMALAGVRVVISLDTVTLTCTVSSFIVVTLKIESISVLLCSVISLLAPLFQGLV